jgi:hypothetical protein
MHVQLLAPVHLEHLEAEDVEHASAVRHVHLERQQ